MPPFLKVGQLEIGDPDCHNVKYKSIFSAHTHQNILMAPQAAITLRTNKKMHAQTSRR
jgi:hypothetical protein